MRAEAARSVGRRIHRLRCFVAQERIHRLPTLPFHPEDHRDMQKEREDVGGGLRREAMQDWLVSDDGKAWRQRQGDLFKLK